jgi:hypothetical protein
MGLCHGVIEASPKFLAFSYSGFRVDDRVILVNLNQTDRDSPPLSADCLFQEKNSGL